MDTKQKILDGIKHTTNKLGWTLISEDWGTPKHQCTCALGCLLVKEDPKNIPILDNAGGSTMRAAQLLKVPESWVDSFIDGFDGNGTAKEAKVPEAWTMGEEVRVETKPTIYSAFMKALEEK